MALSADQIVHALYQRGLDVGPNGGVSMRPGLPLEMRRDLARGFAMTGSYLSATESMLISEVRADLPQAVERHRAEESAAARRAYEVRRAEQAAKVDPKAAQPARQAPPVPVAPVSAMGMGDDLPFTPAAARVIAPGSPPPAPGPATGATHRHPVEASRDHDAVRNAPLDRGADGAPRLAPSGPSDRVEVPGVDAVAARGRAVRPVNVVSGVPATLDARTGVQGVSSDSKPGSAPETNVGRCAACGRSLAGRRPEARTCSTKCRVRFHRARHTPPKPVPPQPMPETPVTPVTRDETTALVSPVCDEASSEVRRQVDDAPPGLMTFDALDGGVEVGDIVEAFLLASRDPADAELLLMGDPDLG